MRIGLSHAVVALLALAAAPAPAATFYVTTGLGAQETTIGQATPLVWAFTPNATDNTVLGAVTAMRYDAGASAGIQIELIDMNAAVIGAVSYADVAAFVLAGGASAYAKFVFALDPPFGVALTPGDPYSLRLSLVGGAPGDTYSIRGQEGDVTITALAAEDIVVTDDEPPPTSTPEPGSALILAAGLLGLRAVRWRPMQWRAVRRGRSAQA